MSRIRYIKGDATSPQASGVKLIAHVCNDAGKWGKGFVVAVSDRWPVVRELYLCWYAGKLKSVDTDETGRVFCWQSPFALGAVQYVQVQRDVIICNMVAQRGIKTGSSRPPIRYDALAVCLMKVAGEAARVNASIHMPRIGCGLAGGRWENVEPIIVEETVAVRAAVTVYDFESES